MLTHTQIIGDLGGHRAAAQIAGVPPSVAHKWLKRGIPARYWPDIAAHAAQSGLEHITIDSLKRPMWTRGEQS